MELALNPNLLPLLACFPRPSVSHFGVSFGMTPLVYNTACVWLYLIDHVTGYFNSCADVRPLLPSSFSMAVGALVQIPYGLFASLGAVLLFFLLRSLPAFRFEREHTNWKGKACPRCMDQIAP
eukprot:scaffold61313_cov56-Cyclotella_meneghiniana.AAC.5